MWNLPCCVFILGTDSSGSKCCDVRVWKCWSWECVLPVALSSVATSLTVSNTTTVCGSYHQYRAQAQVSTCTEFKIKSQLLARIYLFIYFFILFFDKALFSPAISMWGGWGDLQQPEVLWKVVTGTGIYERGKWDGGAVSDNYLLLGYFSG